MRRSDPIEKKTFDERTCKHCTTEKKKKNSLFFAYKIFQRGPGYFDEAGGNSKQKITLFWPNARPIFEYIVDICLYESK